MNDNLIQWIPINVFIKNNKTETIYLPKDLSKEKITSKINEKFGEHDWITYDII